MNIADKAVIFSVYEGMERTFRSFMEKRGLDIPIVKSDELYYPGGGSRIREVVMEQIAKGKEIFIARGTLAKLVRGLQEEHGIKLIEIFVSGTDVLQVLHRYVGYKGKLAVIECDTFTEKVQEICDILGIDITIYEIEHPGQYKEAYEQAEADGMDVIIGAGREEYASRFVRAYRGDMIQSSESAIAESLEAAYYLFEEIYEERRKNDLLRTILNYSTEGIVSLDKERVIRAINEAAARELGAGVEEAMGKRLTDLAPALRPALEGEDLFYNKVYAMQSRQFVVSRVPVLTGGDKTGEILFLQPTQRVLETEQKLRRQRAQKGLSAKWNFRDIQTNNEQMLASIDAAKRYSWMDSTILITGETGVGKELFAQSIHNNSPRRNEAFLAVNCSALPPTLLESELFGYDEGSFTGALRSGKPGIFERAHQGTIFLDEIGELDQAIQAKLLRVLQERQVMRLGGDRVIPVDVKIIAATNRNLELETQQGRFRKDLYYRLNVLNLHIPPLRERKDDLPLLIEHTLNRLNRSLKCKVTGLDARLQNLFEAYDWPGNIRQLNNMLEKIVAMTQWGEAAYEKIRPALSEFDTAPASAPALAASSLTMNEIEQACILARLRQHKGNKTRTAQSLGIGYATLLRKLKEYGCESG